MRTKSSEAPTFAEVMCEKRISRSKNQFLDQVDQMVDWRPLRTFLNKKYTRKANAVGAPSYDVIMMFKILLLQTWYGMSDYEAEDRINDSISFGRFLGLGFEDCAPDHSTICRFRNALVTLGIMEKACSIINKQFVKYGVTVKKTVIVDASIVDTPYKPDGKRTIEVSEDREDLRTPEERQAEEDYHAFTLKEKPGTDYEARWTKKGKTYRYGYKKHVATNEDGIILSVVTTPANVTDVTQLEAVIEQIEDLPREGCTVLADKGYASNRNRTYLREKHLEDNIMRKGSRGRPLSREDKLFNLKISPIRSTIERSFGSIKRWFQGGVCRYYGLAKTHSQNLLEALAFNLYRMPRLIVSHTLK